MMFGRFIKRMFRSIINWANTDQKDSADYYGGTALKSSMPMSSGGAISISDPGRGLHFTVYSATGGKVIEMKTYDSRTDRTNYSLYIVTDKEDMGEELSQIITKESLCR